MGCNEPLNTGCQQSIYRGERGLKAKRDSPPYFISFKLTWLYLLAGCVSSALRSWSSFLCASSIYILRYCPMMELVVYISRVMGHRYPSFVDCMRFDRPSTLARKSSGAASIS